MVPTIVSAPGKVLVTGAYLVLEAPHAGLVLSTSARFYAAASPLDVDAGEQVPAVVEVVSPQLGQTMRYRVDITPAPTAGEPAMSSASATASVSLRSEDGTPGSPYIAHAVACALNAALLMKKGQVDEGMLRELLAEATCDTHPNGSAGLRMVVAGDNDFYSQRAELVSRGLPLSSASLRSLPRFASATQNKGEGDQAAAAAGQGAGTSRPLPAVPGVASHAPGPTQATPSLMPEVAKTGLGSSAALVTSVVGAVLAYLRVIGGRGLGAADGITAGEMGRHTGDTRAVAHARGAMGGDGSGDGSSADDGEAAPHGPGCAAHPLDEEGGDRLLVHRVAQLAHCLAQGKVGSGFDVSAAVFGSQRYVRFSPSHLGAIATSTRHQVADLLSRLVPVPGQPPPSPWDEQRRRFALPRGLVLMVGEPGTGGTSTPSMVGGIQAWRRKEPAAASELWASLAQANADVEAGLRSLDETRGALGDAAYDDAMEACAGVPYSQWRDLSHPPAPAVYAAASNSLSTPRAAAAGEGGTAEGSNTTEHSDAANSAGGMASSAHSSGRAGASAACQLVAARLRDVCEAFARVRALLREMGERAGVPVEPPSQTRLLDATCALAGVLLAGVPGAGGFDAVFAIALGAQARERVETEWARWQVLALCAQEDARGLRVEPATAVEGTPLLALA
eukprot:jgi/Mesvir1/1702/Mv21161-RA.1